MTWEKIIEDGLYFPDSRTHDCQGYQLYDLWYKYLKFTLLNNIVYVSTPCLIEIINAIGPIYSSTYALTLLLPKEALSQINFKSRASHPEAYDMCLVSLVCNYLEMLGIGPTLCNTYTLNLHQCAWKLPTRVSPPL